jgi:hypothetical protein
MDNFHIWKKQIMLKKIPLVYLYKRHNKLIDEQRAHHNNQANILYDTAVGHIDTPI